MRAYQNKRVGKSLSGKACKLPHRTAPLPLPLPVARANPLPRVPRPPRTGIPFRPIREGGAGVENLDTVFEEGGFSTKDVSVVKNVASGSLSCGPCERLGPNDSFNEACCWARLKDSGTGASGKSTQKAFIFMPYKNPAKLSLNRAKLSCMSCKCMKLASRSAIESDSSAKAGSSDSSGEEVV